MKRFMCFLFLTTVLALHFSVFASDSAPATILRVIDGDTLEVWFGDAAPHPGGGCLVDHGDAPCPNKATVRLLGVDTPEMRANRKAELDAREWGVTMDALLAAGRKARTFVVAVAPPGIEVGITVDGTDVYGRTLACVYLPDGRCLNDLLLRAGAARAPPRYRHDRSGEFAALEQAAKKQHRGFWKILWKNL